MQVKCEQILSKTYPPLGILWRKFCCNLKEILQDFNGILENINEIFRKV